MYTATTNLIAAAQEKDHGSSSSSNNPHTTTSTTQKTLVTSLRLALIVGILFGTILGTSASHLLKLLIGNDALDPTVFASSLRYVQIRCLGMPAAVVIGTAQSACLGMKDVKSPLYVLAAAALINLFGDMVLVRNSSVWLGGCAGAAWATVLSQYGALFMFLKWMTLVKSVGREAKSKVLLEEEKEVKYHDGDDSAVDTIEMESDAMKKKDNVIKVNYSRDNAFASVISIRKTLFTSSKQEGAKDAPTQASSAPARGFLGGQYNEREVLNVYKLDKATAKQFLPFVIPVTTTSIGRVSGFLTMSHVASSAFGTLDMAAHQIAISIFCCLAPIVDALNQVAQSFVPGIYARKKSKERAVALRKTSLNFIKVGAAFGTVLVALVLGGVPLMSRFFTTDVNVLARVKNAIPGIALFLGFDGLMCVSEGTLLGQKDLKFLRNSYAAFFFLVPAFMLRLKRRALSGVPVGIGAMWGTFSAYEVFRTVLFLSRVVQLQLRTGKDVAGVESSKAQ